MNEPNIQELLDTLPLLPKHIADLARSGISEAQARAAGIRSVSTPKTISTLLGWSRPATALGPCILFTFHDRAGNLIDDYARLKPDKPRIAMKGDGKGKPIKYESPRGKSNRVYLPLGIGTALEPADPILSSELFFTEGEKKALAATLAGFHCIGLVGVEGWSKPRDTDPFTKRKIGERSFIDDLNGIDWKGRRVYIVYDSDAAQNRGVQRAEKALADALIAAGAIVHIVRLPDLPNGDKCGIDDYLVAHGRAELRKLIDAAPPYVNKPGEPGRDSEIIVGTDEYRVNAQAAKSLAKDLSIYQSGHQLVRVLQEDESDLDGIKRPAGPTIAPLPLSVLRDKVSETAKFTITRFNARIRDWSGRCLKVSCCLLISLQGGNGYGSSVAKGRRLDRGDSGS